jgi:hypothetical protein
MIKAVDDVEFFKSLFKRKKILLFYYVEDIIFQCDLHIVVISSILLGIIHFKHETLKWLLVQCPVHSEQRKIKSIRNWSFLQQSLNKTYKKPTFN